MAGSGSGLGWPLGKILQGMLLELCFPLGLEATEVPQAAGPGTRVGAHLQGLAQGWQPPDLPHRSLWSLASRRPLGAAGIAALGIRSRFRIGLSWSVSWGFLSLSPRVPPPKVTRHWPGGRFWFPFLYSEIRSQKGQKGRACGQSLLQSLGR